MTAPMKFRTTGLARKLKPSALPALLAHAEEWGVPVTQEDGRFRLDLWGALAILAPVGEGYGIELGSPEELFLRALQDAISEAFAEQGAEISWTDVAEGALAPGLALMKLASAGLRSPGFLRLRVEGPEAPRFAAEHGLHFRLLLPPQDRAPIWPRVGPTGRVIWPRGEDRIHAPAYTTADQGADWIEFEVFRHEGSPTCAWLDRDPLGRMVGILGPNGGLRPEGAPLLLFGDETAIPAVSRILRLSAQPDARAWISCADPEDLGDLRRDPRATRATDLLAALERVETPQGSHVWFAAHASLARAARAHLLGRGLARTEFTVAAYWE
ncbi:siderophore-interacting protein [Neomegalonema sp.]|uniref:siderophore-interacting protein n=1 Tax=Neomegalonema sp. TaxID=2039713 RepID=UPI0026128630|nr:siderophore-interacting protein [Neomegalonema sp.]MDD2867811.1 siderophore-interacting protein [Neomegalonema sp.]